MIKTCRACGLRSNTACAVLKTEIKLDNAACPYYDSNPQVCEVCGQMMLKDNSILILEDSNIRITCPSCYSKLNSCAGCGHAESCRFETDPSPLPKIIQQQVRQGPMTSITTVKNPDRINITCKDGCPCWDSVDEACNREIGICGGYICLLDC